MTKLIDKLCVMWLCRHYSERGDFALDHVLRNRLLAVFQENQRLSIALTISELRRKWGMR